MKAFLSCVHIHHVQYLTQLQNSFLESMKSFLHKNTMFYGVVKNNNNSV